MILSPHELGEHQLAPELLVMRVSSFWRPAPLLMAGKVVDDWGTNVVERLIYLIRCPVITVYTVLL